MKSSLYLFLTFATFLSIAITLSNTKHVPVPRMIYTFPPNIFIENIAVRSNGALLLTSLSTPELYTLDPLHHNPKPSLVHTFTNSSGLMGITEISPDKFVVVTGIWDLAATRATLGSLKVWTVDLRWKMPFVQFVVTVAESTVLNGLAAVDGSDKFVLAADSDAGKVWKMDVVTGDYEVAFSDSLFLPTGTTPGTNLGINGLRVDDRYAYFTNSAQGIFGRVPINKRGEKVGPTKVLAKSPADLVYDDMAIRGKDIWIATHLNQAIRINSDRSQTIITHKRLLLNPTSAAFGRGSRKERQTIYVTNGGEFSGNDLINSGVVAIDT